MRFGNGTESCSGANPGGDGQPAPFCCKPNLEFQSAIEEAEPWNRELERSALS